MAASLKKTTFLKGLAVVKLPHLKLGNLYTKLLRALAQLPEDSAYRIYTEQIVKERSEKLKNIADIPTLEKEIDCGQVEELMIQAQNELLLARKMIVWKPWEPLVEQEPPNQWTWPPHNFRCWTIVQLYLFEFCL
ncbi:hypothetical protein PV328_002217 [Microctonus aethiopoides]|uniref:NADH dehydrogenase [ubiquinone] 1 alpha subcomplex subunit 5 n=1 Tax=Microctonus aethiopoides TaxID=144406 RepID=A0AA39FZ95_9HYME|nr:hypothetical protein PV328_002217 [Microctonus aethiopoides]